MKAFAAILAALAALTPIQAPAQGLPGDIAVAQIVPGWRDADGTHYAALAIDLAPGWKTYWRRPGEGGIPPVFDWTASANLRDVTVSFPVPEVHLQNGVESIGYADRVVFPLAIRPETAGREIRLEGQILIGVCEEICIPMDLIVSAPLPATGQSGAQIVRAAMADRPMAGAEAGVGDVTCDIQPISDGLRLTARIAMPPMAARETAVIELPDPSVWVSSAETARSGATLSASVDMVPPHAAPFALSRQDVRITVFAAGQAVEIQGCG